MSSAFLNTITASSSTLITAIVRTGIMPAGRLLSAQMMDDGYRLVAMECDITIDGVLEIPIAEDSHLSQIINLPVIADQQNCFLVIGKKKMLDRHFINLANTVIAGAYHENTGVVRGTKFREIFMPNRCSNDHQLALLIGGEKKPLPTLFNDDQSVTTGLSYNNAGEAFLLLAAVGSNVVSIAETNVFVNNPQAITKMTYQTPQLVRSIGRPSTTYQSTPIYLANGTVMLIRIVMQHNQPVVKVVGYDHQVGYESHLGVTGAVLDRLGKPTLVYLYQKDGQTRLCFKPEQDYNFSGGDEFMDDIEPPTPPMKTEIPTETLHPSTDEKYM